MVLRRIMGPSLETGAIFDAALSGNYCAIADCVSVSAVQEKCDEKGGSLGLQNPMRETAVESHPFGFPLGFARGFGKTGQALFAKYAKKDGAPVLRNGNSCGIPLIAKNAMSGAPSLSG